MSAEGAAVVTGASRGIGRAVAVELAARGFDAVATMRDPASGATLPDEAAARGGRLRVERLDVTDPNGFEMPAGLSLLVNNAAVERPHLPVEHTPLSDWRAMFETNVFGLIEVTRRAIPVLRERGGGVVVNITSSSILAPVPFYAVYRASKAAVSAIGESLRTELAPFGIRVLEVMPGPIDTDMLVGSAEPPAALVHEPYRPMAERMHQGRLDIAPMIASTADAARAIADATLDDSSPLRVGCDELGLGLIEAWRGQSDEDMMRSMLPAWGGT
jgi:NAD(P)-dependent dehydrogenase (short-subunit alcohol dehydrogenase family)